METAPPPPQATGTLARASASASAAAAEGKGDAEGLRGFPLTARDAAAQAQEREGILKVEVVTNDRTPRASMLLLNSKKIFSAQLPKMPREYIVRLVMDRKHKTLCMLKRGVLCGCVCYRPNYPQRFAEIVFLAVDGTEQVKGYGTRLMNHLKEHCKKGGISHFLTYADNYAIGYFRKQGFSKQVTMPRSRWVGYIKDYDGGTLMECAINPFVDYLRLPSTLEEQMAMVYEKARRHFACQLGEDGEQKTYTLPAADGDGDGENDDDDDGDSEDRMDVDEVKAAPSLPGGFATIWDIPGVKEAGWTAEVAAAAAVGSSSGVGVADGAVAAGGGGGGDMQGGGVGGAGTAGTAGSSRASARQSALSSSALCRQLGTVLTELKRAPNAEPFLQPVDTKEVVDYLQYIQVPMDLSTIAAKLRASKYSVS